MLDAIDWDYQAFVLLARGMEHIVTFCCYGCRKPILQPSEWKAVNLEGSSFDTQLLGTVNGEKVYAVGGQLRAYHLECLGKRQGPWLRATNILQTDQRYDIEKTVKQREHQNVK